MGAIRSLVNSRSLQHECSRVLYEDLFVPVLMYGSETTVRREKHLGLGLYLRDFFWV